MTRRQFTGGIAALLACARAVPSFASERSISFGVFSLFEPREITLNVDRPLLVKVDERCFPISPDNPPIRIRCEGVIFRMLFGAQTYDASRLRVISPAGGSAGMILAVPSAREHGGIRRRFQGSLEVEAVNGFLRPIVSMDTETAVASIVDAECPRNARGMRRQLPSWPRLLLRGHFYLPRKRPTLPLIFAIRLTASSSVGTLLPARQRRALPLVLLAFAFTTMVIL
jgi:hypothetical protein